MTAETPDRSATVPPRAASGHDLLQLLSYLHTALGIMILMVALVPLVTLGVAGELAAGGEEIVRTEGARAADALARLLAWGVLIAGALAAATVIWGARALATRRGWARAVISTVVLCFFFPLGTLLGGYTLTRLFDPPTRASFG